MQPWITTNASSLIRGRVILAGLPHTGTTTIANMLRLFGCLTIQGMGTGGDHVGPGLSTHFLESGWGVTDAKLALDKAPSARHLRNKKGGLARLMVEEASNWQCLMDAPWDHAWRSLTLAPFGDTEAHVVLTRVLTPTHYAMTVNAFHTRHHLAGFDWNATVKAYESRLANVRAAHYRNPRYFEICFACGDDGFTLARSLGLDLKKVAALPDISQGVHMNRHPPAEDAERVRLVRKHAAAVALYRGRSSEEAEMRAEMRTGGRRHTSSTRRGKGKGGTRRGGGGRK